jgi:cbb3-type cytochrome oxidase subunit 3
MKNFLFSICEAMKDPAPVCLNTPVEAGMGWGTIFFIILFIIIVNIVFIYCYKRIVNRSLETSIEDKIQTQTIFSLGQYKVFQDAEPSKKVLVRNEDI